MNSWSLQPFMKPTNLWCWQWELQAINGCKTLKTSGENAQEAQRTQPQGTKATPVRSSVKQIKPHMRLLWHKALPLATDPPIKAEQSIQEAAWYSQSSDQQRADGGHRVCRMSELCGERPLLCSHGQWAIQAAANQDVRAGQGASSHSDKLGQPDWWQLAPQGMSVRMRLNPKLKDEIQQTNDASHIWWCCVIHS